MSVKINKIIFFIYQYLYLFPKGYISLRNEMLLHKKKLILKSKKKSIIFFTTHKAASSFFDKFFDQVAKKNNLIKINFDEYILRYPDRKMENIYYESSNETGLIFAPIRKFQNFKNINKYKTVLLLRDPRDVLVSHFFSVMVSHPVNSIKLIKMREKYKSTGIDQYVIDKSNWMLSIYEEYMKKLDDYYYINYSNLILNPLNTINDLLNYLEIKLDEKILFNLVKDLESPMVENIKKHKRSGKSGQYNTYLKKETLEILNNKFKPILDNFNF